MNLQAIEKAVYSFAEQDKNNTFPDVVAVNPADLDVIDVSQDYSFSPLSKIGLHDYDIQVGPAVLKVVACRFVPLGKPFVYKKSTPANEFPWLKWLRSNMK